MGETVAGAVTSELDSPTSILVEELVPDDAQPMFELMQKNKEFLEPVDIYVPEDTQDMLDKINRPLPEGRRNLGVRLGEELIGGIDLIPQTPSRTELVYWIDDNHKGKGFARESLGQVVQLAFNEPPVNTLRAWVLQDNIASQRTLESVGFRHEDTNPNTGSYGYTLTKSQKNT